MTSSNLDSDWHEEYQAFETHVSAAKRAGAPVDPNAAKLVRARLLQALSSSGGLNSLREAARDSMSDEALEEDWFRELGDPRAAPPSALVAIVALAHCAVERARVRSEEIRDERARQERERARQEREREERRRQELIERKEQRRAAINQTIKTMFLELFGYGVVAALASLVATIWAVSSFEQGDHRPYGQALIHLLRISAFVVIVGIAAGAFYNFGAFRRGGRPWSEEVERPQSRWGWVYGGVAILGIALFIFKGFGWRTDFYGPTPGAWWGMPLMLLATHLIVLLILWNGTKTQDLHP